MSTATLSKPHSTTRVSALRFSGVLRAEYRKAVSTRSNTGCCSSSPASPSLPCRPS